MPMRRLVLVFLAVFAAACAVAAKVPVAEGYPAWEGLDERDYIWGRKIVPSDLRQKVTVVVEVAPTDEESAREQLLAAASVVSQDSFAGIPHAVVWSHYKMPRGVTVVVSDCGGKESADLLLGVLKSKDEGLSKKLETFKRVRTPVYRGITFPGAPGPKEGKRPFAYVMGHAGVEPLFAGALDAKGLAALKAAVKAAKAKLPKWRPFYGSVVDPQHFKGLETVLNSSKPKPLAAEFSKIRKGIQDKDPEVSKEAQILYDAIEQTRSDLVARISMEVWTSPYRAAYDVAELTKYWPSEKRSVARYVNAIKAVPDADKLGTVFGKIVAWADPSFECKNEAEAKKIVSELRKMKKTLERLKASKNMTVQGGAMALESEVDELIDVIPSKVAPK